MGRGHAEDALEALGALEQGDLGVGHADAVDPPGEPVVGSKKKAFEEQSDQLVADAIRDGSVGPNSFDQRCR